MGRQAQNSRQNALCTTLYYSLLRARARSCLALKVSCPKCPKCDELDFQRALPPAKAGQIKDTSHGLKLMTIKKVIGLQSKTHKKTLFPYVL